MQKIADIIYDVLKNRRTVDSARQDVLELLSGFPLYPDLGELKHE
jgi:glycine/serine hydroxymethyltransferase